VQTGLEARTDPYPRREKLLVFDSFYFERMQNLPRRGGTHLACLANDGCLIEMAQQLDIDPQWIYRGIAKGRIEISKDSTYGCYLFPRTKAAVDRMRQLKFDKVRQVIFRKAHGDD
jgi:hypothetical protein